MHLLDAGTYVCQARSSDVPEGSFSEHTVHLKPASELSHHLYILLISKQITQYQLSSVLHDKALPETYHSTSRNLRASSRNRLVTLRKIRETTRNCRAILQNLQAISQNSRATLRNRGVNSRTRQATSRNHRTTSRNRQGSSRNRRATSSFSNNADKNQEQSPQNSLVRQSASLEFKVTEDGSSRRARQAGGSPYFDQKSPNEIKVAIGTTAHIPCMAPNHESDKVII